MIGMVLLHGAGEKAFCAGGDVLSLVAPGPIPMDKEAPQMQFFRSIFLLALRPLILFSSPLPTAFPLPAPTLLPSLSFCLLTNDAVSSLARAAERSTRSTIASQPHPRPQSPSSRATYSPALIPSPLPLSLSSPSLHASSLILSTLLTATAVQERLFAYLIGLCMSMRDRVLTQRTLTQTMGGGVGISAHGSVRPLSCYACPMRCPVLA